MKPKQDHGLSAIQYFLREEARKLRYLFCAVCRIEPPKYEGGPCDTCGGELGAS